MKKYSARFAITVVTLAIGIAIGIGSNEASKEGAGVAKAVAKEKAEKTDAGVVKTEKATVAKEKAGKSDVGKKKVKRYGMVIGVKKETLAEYIRIHEKIPAGVAKMITDCNIRNFSIYLGKLDDGKEYLFGYFEYIGDDYDADMAKMKVDKATQEWWKLTDPMQIELKNRKKDEHWMTMEEVFHQD